MKVRLPSVLCSASELFCVLTPSSARDVSVACIHWHYMYTVYITDSEVLQVIQVFTEAKIQGCH